MRAEVSDATYGDTRHSDGCECRTCRRRAALRPGRVPLVDEIENHSGSARHGHPHPDPRGLADVVDRGDRDAPDHLSPLDHADGWSLRDMR
jgi:hypothetical protein